MSLARLLSPSRRLHPHLPPVAALSPAGERHGDASGDGGGTEIAAASAATVVLAVTSRVLYKLALVSMKNFPFFLRQFTSFGMPRSPFATSLQLLYITLNMAFNISRNLVKMSTAPVASLASTLAVPLSIYVLSLPLPYLPEATSCFMSTFRFVMPTSGGECRQDGVSYFGRYPSP